MTSFQDTAFRNGPYLSLPAELFEALNSTYFLHRLATQPETVIPPGKTLLSMLLHSRINEDSKGKSDKDLLERVKEVAHEAFWNEVCPRPAKHSMAA